MDHPNDTDQRLTDLEIKASFTEDLVDSLNAVSYTHLTLPTICSV